MNNLNRTSKEYNKLCNDITYIRDTMINIKERMFFENNSDELRHMNYSLEEMQIELKEKMVLLNKN